MVSLYYILNLNQRNYDTIEKLNWHFVLLFTKMDYDKSLCVVGNRQILMVSIYVKNQAWAIWLTHAITDRQSISTDNVLHTYVNSWICIWRAALLFWKPLFKFLFNLFVNFIRKNILPSLTLWCVIPAYYTRPVKQVKYICVTSVVVFR